MIETDMSPVPGFVVPSWSSGVSPRVEPICLAPSRRAPDDLARLIVDSVGVGRDDVFVDLGSGDGSVVASVVESAGCFGVGVEAVGELVVLARERASARGVGDRVLFLHELIGVRGLLGATVACCWLLPGGLDVVVDLIEVAVASGSFRALVVVGDSSPFAAVGSFD